MPSIQLEQFIWTTKDITCVPDGTLGCHCYREKGKSQSKYGDCRQAYEEKRGIVTTLNPKHHGKLLESLREVETLLQQYAVVDISWREEMEIQLMLENGVFVLIGLSESTYDPERHFIDKSLLGKLENISLNSAGIGETCLVLANDSSSSVDIATFFRPFRRSSFGSEASVKENSRAASVRKFEKLSGLSLKLGTLSLGLPDGLQVRKRIRFNCRNDKFAVWWSSHLWPPADDLHNVTICNLVGPTANKMLEFTTEYPLVALDFRRSTENEFAVAELQQKSKDNFVLHVSLYELRESQMSRKRKTCVALSDAVVAWDIHPQEEMFLLRTKNGKCILYDMNYQQTKDVVHSNVAVCRWHPIGVLFYVLSVSGEITCYDIAAIPVNFLFQDTFAAKPRASVSLLKYFRCNKKLIRMTFNRANPSQILVLHESGPFSLLVTGDTAVCTSHVDLIHHYCVERRLQDSVKLLRSLHWNSTPDVCFLSLSRILNTIMSTELVKENISLCEEALGSFYVSRTPLSETIKIEFQEKLLQLTRRFFFFLLRHKQMEKAFLLAEDLGHADLFSDIYHTAMKMGDPVLAEVARLRTLKQRRETKEEDNEELSENSSQSSLVIDDEDVPEELLAPDREDQFAFEESLLHDFTALLSADIDSVTPRPP